MLSARTEWRSVSIITLNNIYILYYIQLHSLTALLSALEILK